MARRITIGLALAAALAGMAQAQTIIYVDASANQTPHDGSSWCHAYLELYEALAAAGSDTVIRVANGTYLPDSSGLGDPREATFQLANGVTIEGGYAGCNDGGDLRDIELYETTLSGDISTPGAPSDNCYHVVTGSATDGTAVLDGFTVTDGNANGSWPRDTGGGMYNSSGSPTLTNCAFTGNLATNNGAGIRNSSNSSPTLTGCTFSGNSAPSGAGMYNNDSGPTLTDCTFSGNSADHGAGMLNDHDSSPTLTDCTFAGNSATVGGGGLYNWINSNPTLVNCAFIANSAVAWAGGMYDRESSPTLTNCTFVGNSTDGEGGGMYIDRGSSILANCIFSGNSADTGGGMYMWFDSNATLTNCTFATNSAPNGRVMACDSLPEQVPSTVEMTNCILWDGGDEIWNNDDSTITITCSNVQGGTGEPWFGEGCIDADPLLAASDLHLKPGSPCLDAGNNAAVPPGVATDLHGLPRFFDDLSTPDTGLGDPPIVDMGAYEYVVVVPAASADLDGDGDVDLGDFALFQQQFTGPQ